MSALVSYASSDEEDATLGPAMGPTRPPADQLRDDDQEQAQVGEPQSPYSANRATLRTLTLPPVQNRDIPPSPPGSPPPSTNKKLAHFLDLKKRGVHFNEKLAKSSAITNPGLMQKLMHFTGISEQEQYATTLPKQIWEPSGFPEWAYKEELGKSQQKMLKKKEDEKARGLRDTVDFVPASASAESSLSGTPGAGGRAPATSAAERVMAGLDRSRSNAPQVQSGLKRKSRFDS